MEPASLRKFPNTAVSEGFQASLGIIGLNWWLPSTGTPWYHSDCGVSSGFRGCYVHNCPREKSVSPTTVRLVCFPVWAGRWKYPLRKLSPFTSWILLALFTSCTSGTGFYARKIELYYHWILFDRNVILCWQILFDHEPNEILFWAFPQNGIPFGSP